MSSGNGADPLKREEPTQAVNPHPVACIELHNYAAGRPEINLVNPEGIGVSFPLEYLELLMKGMELVKLLRPGVERGHTVFVTVDSEGRCDWEFGKEQK